MSSKGGSQIRKRITSQALAIAILLPAPLAAQEETERPDGSVEIDILVTPEELFGPPPPMEDCSDEQEAAILSGEIVVCRRKQDQRKFRTLPEEYSQRRYARETMNKDNPQTPDPCGPNCGIFKGPPTVGGICIPIPGVQKCPPPPALIIDVTALPKAPSGSDADRISRGLPPLGNDKGDDRGDEAEEEMREEQLGLPEAPQ